MTEPVSAIATRSAARVRGARRPPRESFAPAERAKVINCLYQVEEIRASGPAVGDVSDAGPLSRYRKGCSIRALAGLIAWTASSYRFRGYSATPWRVRCPAARGG